MLVARATKTLGSARFATSLVFAPGVWMSIIERAKLTLDTRFAPAERGPAREGTCLYLIRRGTIVLGGERFDGPVAFALSESQMEGARGVRTTTFLTCGTPFEAIELHLSEADVQARPKQAPARLEVDDATWDAVARTINLARATAGDAEPLVDAALELLRVLAAERHLAARVVESARRPLKFEKLWRAARPLAERFALSATIDELGALSGASSRSLDRYLRSFFETFAMIGGGWRPAMVHLRLKLAVMFLSAEGVTVSQVAAAVGYGSADAMARAFRDAGLPAPITLRESIVPSQA